MPNKDSFTFSDKLKKSKSLPLSKRIPSKVGGDGKAKRTLIQRAQRDLPFIIVAAAALLLLPILSRNSGTDDLGVETPMDFVSPDTSLSDSGGLGQEIAPSSGFKNPLDYIVSRSGKDTDPNRDTIDADEEEPGYEPTTPPYTSETGGEPNATTKYAPAAKGAIRNALVRKATQISALRNSKTMAAGASTGVSRSLATGSAASSGGASGPRVGVRPVALQPMASAGKGGRSETGEGLYAEAARSLGAMNRSGSKQALFDAQLKNVDGTPLGSIGGGPNFGAGAGKLGAGGAPSNNVGYKPYLPWWWDFEKQKAMKMWELWNYNFQKALSDNIIKVGTSLALCLTTGNADGKVDKFLGDPGGNPDYICKGAEDTVMSWADYRDNAPKTESGSSDNKESRTSASYADWLTECKEAGGKKEVSSSDRKNMLDVRLRCLGLKYKKSGLYKWLQKAQYSEKDNCVGVSGDSGIIKFELTSTKDSKKDLMGHYVVAKDMKAEKPSETVIYIAKGGKLDGVVLRDRIKTINGDKSKNFVVTKVIGFTTNINAPSDDASREFWTGNPDKKANKMAVLNDMTDAEKAAFAKSRIKDKTKDLQSAIADIKNKNKGKTMSEEDTKKMEGLIAKLDAYQAMPEEQKVKQVIDEEIASINTKKEKIENKIEKASEYKYGKKFAATIESIIARIDGDAKEGRSMSETYVQDSLDIKVQKTCSVGTKFLGTEMTNMHHALRGSEKDNIVCGSVDGKAIEPTKYVKIKDSRSFSVTIKNPGACVYAVVVERAPITKDTFIVKRVVNFQNATDGLYKSEPDAEGNVTLKFDSSVGIDETSSKDAKAEEQNGNGWVYWVTNNSCDGVAAVVDKEVNPDDLSTIINSYSAGGQKFGICHYRWACATGGCAAEEKPNTKEYCRKTLGNGSYALFDAIPADNKTSVATGTQLAEINGGVTKDKYDKYFLGKEWFDKMDAAPSTFCTDCFTQNIPECVDVCVDAEGNVSVKEANGTFKPIDPVVKKADIKGLTAENCPDCVKPVTSAPPDEIKKKCSVVFGDVFAHGKFDQLNSAGQTFLGNALVQIQKCIEDPKIAKPLELAVIGHADVSGDEYCDEQNCYLTKDQNKALSVDRAYYIADQFVADLNKMTVFPVCADIKLKDTATATLPGWKNTRYTPVVPSKICDDPTIKVTFVVEGLGTSNPVISSEQYNGWITNRYVDSQGREQFKKPVKTKNQALKDLALDRWVKISPIGI